MSDPLAGFEQKVAQVVALCDALRADNRRLRERIDTLEDANQTLADRMTTARERLENLIDKLPAE